MPQEIFRTYDIRGVVDDTLTPDVVFQIAQAFGSEARAQHQTKVVIARDGRLSGPTLGEALKKGLLAAGCDVIDIGQVPTPLLYFATHILDTHTGIMLTGSHNPKNYNGLKMVINGKTLAEQTIQNLYQRIIKKNIEHGQGRYQQTDIVDRYIERIKHDIKLKKKLTIVIDCGNGIAGNIAPKLYRALGCDVIELFCEVDGNFPNHHPDPSIPENLNDLIHAVKKHQADVGLAFDGDADRLGVVTNEGEIIWPDRQLMLYAIDVLSRNPQAEIIFDVKCTKHLASVIKEHHGKPIMWKTGHSLIKQKMQEIGAPLAGEMSGHTFFKERWYGFDDGLYTGVRLLEILAKDTRSASELFKTLPNSVNTPELKLAVTNEQRSLIINGLKNSSAFAKAKVNTIDGIRADFAHSWGLVRGSNTTSHLILRFEADDEKGLLEIQHIFREELLKLDSHLQLPF